MNIFDSTISWFLLFSAAFPCSIFYWYCYSWLQR